MKMGFLEDNKEVYESMGALGLIVVYGKLILYLLIIPVGWVWTIYKGFYWASLLLFPLSFLSVGITFGGRRFIKWLTDKFLLIREKVWR